MDQTIRVGMIGCDTSHCGHYTKRLNEATPDSLHFGAKVVACYPSFSKDVPDSVSRVERFKKELQDKWQVRMVDSIDTLLKDVDAVLLSSVDGRRHLKELEPVVKSGKPVYIDKPFAASLADAKAMVKLIKETKTPAFGCSPLRFDSRIAEAARFDKANGKVIGCDTFGPAKLEPTNPGLFWYGIHAIEILYTFMGAGCKTVQCASRPDGDMVVGMWGDDRLGTMRGIRKGKSDYGAMVMYEKVSPKLITPKRDYYDGTTTEIVKFFKTRMPPVDIDTTLEIYAFIDAAARSAKQDGCAVELGLSPEHLPKTLR